MNRNFVFGAIVGLFLGMVIGYILAERQSVPPASAVGPAAVQGNDGLPEGHPPIPGSSLTGEQERALVEQASQLQLMLEQRPDDVQLMVSLGNLYFDAARWPDSRDWYEKALDADDQNPNVLTDYAVVLRNLNRQDDALSRLDQALAINPDHWQARYNKVIVLHFDLHRHDEARSEFAKLVELRKTNSNIPDLSPLRAELEG